METRNVEIRFPAVFIILALIFYGSLYPWHFDFSRSHNPLLVLLDSWPPVFNRWIIRDIFVNLVLYVPVGATAYLSFVRRLGRPTAFCAATLLGLALSTAVELIQVYVPTRTSSLTDVLCNLLGTAAGATAGALLQTPLRTWSAGPVRRYGAAGIGLLAFWMGYQLYPFFPIPGRTRLRAGLVFLTHPHMPSLVEIWASAGEWFAAALLLEALLGRLRPMWLAAAMACLAARPFMVSRTLTPDELCGALLALVLWARLPDRLRLQAGAGLLFSGIILRELAPFRFSPTPSTFSWIPFDVTLENERQGAFIVLCRKAFDYGAAVWVLRAYRVPYLSGGVAVAAALLGFEVLQRFLPGRSAELTDSLLTLLLALLLRLVSD